MQNKKYAPKESIFATRMESVIRVYHSISSKQRRAADAMVSVILSMQATPKLKQFNIENGDLTSAKGALLCILSGAPAAINPNWLLHDSDVGVLDFAVEAYVEWRKSLKETIS